LHRGRHGRPCSQVCSQSPGSMVKRSATPGGDCCVPIVLGWSARRSSGAGGPLPTLSSAAGVRVDQLSCPSAALRRVCPAGDGVNAPYNHAPSNSRNDTIMPATREPDLPALGE